MYYFHGSYFILHNVCPDLQKPNTIMYFLFQKIPILNNQDAVVP